MNKNKKDIASLSKVLCAGLLSFGLLSTANATLEIRLGGLAVYDTDFAPVPGSASAWTFFFSNGNQLASNKVLNELNAWAVHSGDVGAAAVPAPGTIALMGLGLAGLLGFGRCQRRR